jgi:hypothetical protein
MTESALDARIAPIYTKYIRKPRSLPNPVKWKFGLLARGKNREEAEELLKELGDWDRSRTRRVYFARSEQSLEESCRHVFSDEECDHCNSRILYRRPYRGTAD